MLGKHLACSCKNKQTNPTLCPIDKCLSQWSDLGLINEKSIKPDAVLTQEAPLTHLGTVCRATKLREASPLQELVLRRHWFPNAFLLVSTWEGSSGMYCSFEM